MRKLVSLACLTFPILTGCGLESLAANEGIATRPEVQAVNTGHKASMKFTLSRAERISFPSRLKVLSATQHDGSLFAAGYVDQLDPTRENAFIVELRPREKAEVLVVHDAQIPGYKAAWSPTSPAYYRPDAFHDVVATDDGVLVAVGRQYNVPSRWGTADYVDPSSGDLLVAGLVDKKPRFKHVWKPKGKGFFDSIGLFIGDRKGDGFLVAGIVATSTGSNLKPKVTDYRTFVNYYSSRGELVRSSLFAKDHMPVAIFVTNERICRVVTCRGGWTAIKELPTTYVVHDLDYQTGQVIKSRELYSTTRNESFSSMKFLPSGNLVGLAGTWGKNEQGGNVWTGSSTLRLFDTSGLRKSADGPKAGGALLVPIAHFAKYGDSLYMAAETTEFWGRSPSFAVYRLTDDLSIEKVGEFTSDVLGRSDRSKSCELVAFTVGSENAYLLTEQISSKGNSVYGLATLSVER
jgi:hypothetical protein